MTLPPSNTRRPQRDAPITHDLVRKLVQQEMSKITGVGGVRVKRVGTSWSIEGDRRRGGAPSPLRTYRITGIQNDYLACEAVGPDGETFGPTVNVAKPPKLWHDADQYAGVNSLTTTNAQEVDVDNGAEETWVVNHPYAVGDDILASRSVIASAVEVSSEPLLWVDMNIDARAWALDESE